MRYYVVDCELGTEKMRFMVKAPSKAAARKHVTDKVTEASVALPDDLVDWVRDGRPVQIAQEDPKATDEAAE